MMSKEDILNNKTLSWILNKSRITNEYPDCVETRFSGKLPYRMLLELIKFFNENLDHKSGTHKVSYKTILCGSGSITLTTYSGINDTNIILGTCLDK